MTEEKKVPKQEETMLIAGKSIPIHAWAIAGQLEAGFAAALTAEGSTFKLKHLLALAVNAGIELHAQRPSVRIDRSVEALQSIKQAALDILNKASELG
jgi:dihydroxyacid dehydratase/phosphogluconate dehydratase